MNRIALTLALATGIACASFGYEPQRHNDTFTTNGITYAQRGGLGASDYVVTNVDLTGFATSEDIEAATNALMTADGMTETPPFKYTGYMHKGVDWKFNGQANRASTANRLANNTGLGGRENASLNFVIVQESEGTIYTSPNRLKFSGAPANEQNENIVAYLSDFSTNNTSLVDTVTNATKQVFGTLETKVDDAKTTATNALDKAETAKKFADEAMLNAGTANNKADYALRVANGAQVTANAATNLATAANNTAKEAKTLATTAVSMISETNETFSTAVLAVGLNIDTNSVATLNEIADTFGGFPIEGTATTVGGLLAALAAAVTWLKKNKVGSFEPVGGASATVENGVAKLSNFFTNSNSLLTGTIDEEVISKGTAPDAHLEAPTDEHLKLILADNSVAYDSAKALPYKLTSVIGDRVIATMTLTAASTDITLPTIAANDTTVKDFILDVTNAYAVEGVATDAGINIPRTDFKLVTRDGESLTDVTTVKAGKSAFLCFTQKSPVVVDGTTYPCWCVIQLPFGDPS